MAKLVLLFTLVPLVELWLLLAIGRAIGFWPTVGIAVGTAFLGAALAKHEGRRVLATWTESLAAGRIPDEGLTGGVLVLLGAALLVSPGVITDLVG
ncbi:MAG TPA: FxsA family protein, partial [Candidatus Nanopelagicales bacterium]|nr:FxsA family protein [Candidatus Nanopelagicales bacterium]